MHRDHEQSLTIAEAAELCDVSTDTIKRDRLDGRYPGATRGRGNNDPWLIPVQDLVSAGRYQPPPGRTYGELRRDQVERREASAAQMELAEARARLLAQDSELAFLRQMVERLTSQQVA